MSDTRPWPGLPGASWLVATHWPPDPDGLATGAGVCALLTGADIEAAFFCPEPVPTRLAWLLEGVTIETCPPSDRDTSCLVLDCAPTLERTRLPASWLQMLEADDRLYSVDHHTDRLASHDGRRHWVEDVPSVACSFLDRGMFHPLFFASLWSDTRGLTVNASASARYFQRLFDSGLTEADAARQRGLLEPKRPEILFRDLTERTKIVDSWEEPELGRVIVVAGSELWRHCDTIHELRHLLTHYASVVTVIDVGMDRVSLWSEEQNAVDLGAFASEVLGGGGHRQMAGGPLGARSPTEVARRLRGYLARRGPSRTADARDTLANKAGGPLVMASSSGTGERIGAAATELHLLTVSIDHFGAAKLGHAGLYRASADLARMFSDAGACVSEVCFGHERGTLPGTTRRVTPREATAMLAAGKITAIYTQYLQPDVPIELATAAWPRVVPVIAICHDLVNAMAPAIAWAAAPARHAADRMVISSEAGARALKKLLGLAGAPDAEDAVEVLPLGTTEVVHAPSRSQARRALGWDNEDTVYLWVGRFSETYKADLRPLLLAFRLVLASARVSQPRLVALGADSAGVVERLRVHAKKLDIASRCTWLPDAADETRDLCLAAADVLVNVSDHVQETFGLANLEAMAHGLPVIASDWSGFREVVRHGETGLLIPSTLNSRVLAAVNVDAVASFSCAMTLDFHALVDAMARLGADDGLRRRMGTAASRVACGDFSWKALAPRYLDLVERAAARARGQPARGGARPWMPEVFSHYATRSSAPNASFRAGPVELEAALVCVDDAGLRRALGDARAALIEGGAHFSQTGHTPGAPLRDVDLAVALLLKLGVLVQNEEAGDAHE